jgi:serine/threonine protein kinase
MHEPFVEREILFKFRQLAPDYFVNLYETHSDNDFIYMIMENCDGGSMESLIKHLN